MEIVKGVHMLECTQGSHVYLIQGEENILIDAGMPGLGQKIVNELKTIGIEPKSVKHILLTHHDVDHIGNAKFLKDITGAALWASDEDIPYINGEINRQGLKRIIQTVVRYEKPFVDRSYSADQHFKNIVVIKTPGHTPGHVIFAYKNVLFTGDLFKNKKGNLNIMPKFMNWDHKELEKSLGIIKKIEFDLICPSHGLPFHRNERWERFINEY